MPHPQFSELLDRARAGDADAVEHVLVRVEERLRRCVDARLGPKMRAALRQSDVLQNTYIRMLRDLPGFPGATEDDFVAWVARIIENDIHREHRYLNAQKRRGPRQTSELNALAEILLRQPPTPSAEVASVEEQEQIARALQSLSAEHAEVLELAVFQGLAHKEVAERMARTEGATRMLLSRARTALALELERLGSA